MKNFIFNNYDINIKDIYKNSDSYFFYVNNEKIYIIKYKGKEEYLKQLFDLTNDLYYRNIMVNTFIINNKNNFYTKKDDSFIILLRENNNYSDIEFSDLTSFFNINTSLDSYDIIAKWSSEIDTLESELIEYNKEYSIIQNSIDYFIGIGENAIELMSNYSNLVESNNDSIGHLVNYKLFERNTLYNPFLFIKTNKMYDVANYIKYKFVNNNISYDEIENIFKKCNEYEEVFLFSCLMFPSTYFDLVKNVLLKEEDEKKILFFVNKVDSYKELLVYCKSLVKNNINIRLINWIK